MGDHYRTFHGSDLFRGGLPVFSGGPPWLRLLMALGHFGFFHWRVVVHIIHHGPDEIAGEKSEWIKRIHSALLSKVE